MPPYLRAARVIEVDNRGGSRVVKTKHGKAFMCSVGTLGWLMGYRNRLWTLNSWGEDRYYRDWPWTIQGLLFKFDWCKAWGRAVMTGQVCKKGSRDGDLQHCRIHNATHHLVCLQRWFREANARRCARRMALGMALHARLGRDCWLCALDQDLLRGLVLAGT